MLILSCASQDKPNEETVGATMDQPEKIRVATFNVSMEARNYLPPDLPRELSQAQAQTLLSADVLKTVLDDKAHPQVRNIAEIIQRVRPDVLLLNEFDYIEDRAKGVDKFQQNFLAVSQGGQAAISYPYVFIAPSNTGVSSGLDLDSDSKVTLPNDAHGYGFYPGQYGMVLLSRFPIDTAQVRTFQTFRWADMPGALMPIKVNGEPYYSNEVWQSLRLSSKSHWDVPLTINGQRVHMLASHPTPPVFDGEENRNGKRNHDEIRFWRDYIDADDEQSAYIYDDDGRRGGLSTDASFIILGDLNASPHSDAAMIEGIVNLLEHDRVQNLDAPGSEAAKLNKPDDPYAAEHTASWGSRADYLIPSKAGLTFIDSGVFWPTPDSPLAPLVENRQSSSDHRLVWMDLQVKVK